MKRRPIMMQLAFIRSEKQVTQRQLAKTLFLNPQAVSKRETGLHMPTLAEVDRQARALGYRLALVPLQGDAP
ncbi:helix-turn-helix transcriptional regulator [Nonomuraea sp. NPDC005650]|uniref:helix-turn-helix domain-containing protein n=1 Tax=Nonomuraea sp. NPDC005650 TaxID=3157045 RepID=UPI0033A039D5